MSFRAPVRDLAFVLTELAGIDRLIATGAYPDFDADLMTAVTKWTPTAAICSSAWLVVSVSRHSNR